MAIIKNSFNSVFNKDPLNASLCQTFYQFVVHESPWKCSEGISGQSRTVKFWWFLPLCAVTSWQIWGSGWGKWGQKKWAGSGLGPLRATFAQGDIWSNMRIRKHLGDQMLVFFWDILKFLWIGCLVGMGMRMEEIRWARGSGAGKIGDLQVMLKQLPPLPTPYGILAIPPILAVRNTIILCEDRPLHLFLAPDSDLHIHKLDQLLKSESPPASPSSYTPAVAQLLSRSALD